MRKRRNGGPDPIPAAIEHLVDARHGFDPSLIAVSDTFQRVEALEELASDLELGGEGRTRGARTALPRREGFIAALGPFPLSDTNPVGRTGRGQRFTVPLQSCHPCGQRAQWGEGTIVSNCII